MKLFAVGIVYDGRFCMSREIEPAEDLTDQDVLEYMFNQADGELDQVLLITVPDDGEIEAEELIK